MRGHAFILAAAALASLIGIERAEAKLDILVDKATQRMFVMQDGYIRYMWPVSTGRDNMATPNGIYTPQRLERSWFSTAYYNSPMPYSIFFHNGYAIHGSYAINQLGGPASHGCVRLHPYHAAVLFDLVQQEGPNNTSIEITDEGRPEQPQPPGPEMVGGPGESPPGPNSVYYAQAGGVAAPPLAVPDNRPIAWKNAVLASNALSPKPGLAGRGMPTDIKPPANMPRALSVAREADPANGAPRLANGPFDSRARSKVVEGPRVAEELSRVRAALSTSSFKLLPASCWSGSAARWRWWASGGGASCK